MKKQLVKILSGISIGICFVFTGCKDDVVAAGAGALNVDEEVRVCSKTFSSILSQTDSVGDFVITQTPDSFLIGEVNTQVWATVKADLITQFACPSGFIFPESSVVDSVALVMTYSSWFAEGNSPLRLSVYELDRATLDYEGIYTSQENVYDFWSGEDSTHVVKEDQMVVAAQPKDSVYSDVDEKYYPYIRFMMNDRFVQKMNTIKKFPSQTEFNQLFKGLYLTTTWGASTALYVDNITLMVYYHYEYEKAQGSGEYERLADVKYLYANNEVRQINRYTFPNKDKVVEEMQENTDSVNYVISPGYVYTILSLPMSQYVDTVLQSMATDKGNTLQPYINKALMRVNVLNVDYTSSTSDKWADPATNMLLINKDSLSTFFLRNNLPSSDYCLLSTLTTSVDSDYVYSYHYDFDVSTMLYNDVHRKMNGENVQSVEMVMIPVNVEYSASSTTGSAVVSKVKINQVITYTEIGSAQFIDNPLDIDVVFSGFTINTLH